MKTPLRVLISFFFFWFIFFFLFIKRVYFIINGLKLCSIRNTLEKENAVNHTIIKKQKQQKLYIYNYSLSVTRNYSY